MIQYFFTANRDPNTKIPSLSFYPKPYCSKFNNILYQTYQLEFPQTWYMCPALQQWNSSQILARSVYPIQNIEFLAHFSTFRSNQLLEWNFQIKRKINKCYQKHKNGAFGIWFSNMRSCFPIQRKLPHPKGHFEHTWSYPFYKTLPSLQPIRKVTDSDIQGSPTNSIFEVLFA